MSAITHDKLRRLALRSIKIHARHADKGPQIASYEHSLVSSAKAFIEAIDAAQKASAQRGSRVRSRHRRLNELGETLRAWLPQLRRDVSGVARQGFGDARRPAEDVMGEVTAILNLVDVHAEQGGDELPYLDEMKAQLQVLVMQVDEAADMTGQARQSVDDLQASARAAASEFSRDLVAFRATLRIVLGSKSPDYRALRIPAASTAIEEYGEAKDADPSASASLTIAQGGISDEEIQVEDDPADEEVAAAS